MKIKLTDKAMQCPHCGRYQKKPEDMKQFTCGGCKKTWSLFPYKQKVGAK